MVLPAPGSSASRKRSRGWGRASECCGFLLRDDCLVQGPIWQADAALEAFGQGTGRFQDNRHIKVARQGDLLADGEMMCELSHWRRAEDEEPTAKKESNSVGAK